jgi:hypothetical protein
MRHPACLPASEEPADIFFGRVTGKNGFSYPFLLKAAKTKLQTAV